MKNNFKEFFSILNIENANYIITDLNFNILSQKALEKNSDSLELIIKNNKINNNVIYSPDISVFIFEQNNRYIFIDNKSMTEGFANYLFIFGNMINTIKESILIIDDDFSINYVNNIFLSRYGYSHEEIMETLLTELFPPEHLELIVKGIKNNRTDDLNVEMYNPKGDTFPVAMKLIKWSNKHLIIIEDKRELESYNREIDGLKKMQKLIFDSIGQGIVVLNKQAELIQFNEFMGYKYRFTKDLIGKNMFETFPDLKELGMDKAFVDIIEKKKIKRILGVRRHSRSMNKEYVQNFTGYPLIENQKPIGVVILLEDLTEKTKLEDDFQSSQRKNKIINKLNSVLSESLELNFVIESICKYILRSLDLSNIIAYNSFKNQIIKYSITATNIINPVSIVNSKQIINKINEIGINEPVIIKDKSIIYDILGKKSIKEIVFIPVFSGNNKLGFFILESKKAIKKKDIKGFINDIADYSGHIIDKSVIYEEKKANLLKLELTLKISRLTSQSKDFSKTFQGLLNIIDNEINAENSIMFVRDLDYETFRSIAVKGKRVDKLKKIDFNIENTFFKEIGEDTIFIDDSLKYESKYPYIKKIFGTKRKSVICVPVKFKNEILGVFIFSKSGANSFSQENYDMVKIIAASSSTYIKNLHLQMQMEGKIAQLSTLYKMSTSIKPIINYTFLKRAIVSSLGSISKADAVLFFKKNNDEYSVENEFYNSIEMRGKIINSKIIPEKMIPKYVGNTIFEMNEEHKFVKKYFNNNQYIKGLRISNSKEKIIIMLVYNDKMNLKISDETFFAIINELSISLENAVLFDENEKRLKQFSSISAITKKLAQLNIRNLDEYYHYIVNAAKELINTEYASLLFVENKRLVFKAFAGINLSMLQNSSIAIGEGVAGYVVDSGKPVIANNVNKNKYFRKLDISSIYEVRSLVNIPLIYRGNVIGVLCADNKIDGEFDENDVNLMKTLTNSTIIALEHFMDIEIGKKLSDIILDNIPSGIIYISRSGIIQHINKGFSNISGYSHNDVFNISYNEVFEDNRKLISEVLKAPKSIMRQEITLIKKNRDSIPCGISITPVKWDKRFDIVCIIQDLSEIKKMQHELKEKENLALLGQMAAGMAHEIKNPLAGILTGLEFLHMQLNEEDDIKKQSIELVIKEVKRLDRLVNDMTSFAKSKIKFFSMVSIDHVIGRAIELTKDKFRTREITIDLNYPDKISKIEIDEEQILEVFINIILNANQAIKDKGKIKVTVTQNSRSCKIEVFNNGPLIPSNVIENIFTPFFTTKSGGTGLGLSISYNIIKEHSGHFEVENVEGGVIFRIVLPIKADENGEE